jgi:tRNA (cmo5U34)-methyltransferase
MNMNINTPYDALFSGIIGKDYQMLKLISPYAPEMSRLVGVEVEAFCRTASQTVNVLELGGGTGITTLAILSANEQLQVLSIDYEAVMQDQAKQNLRQWHDAGRLRFVLADALLALRELESNSVDVLASAYTLHNFPAVYRQQVLVECFRVLKPGGRFVNGDRYALDDTLAHTRNTQNEVAGYFKVSTELNRLDLLEHWIIHLFNDESENCIMREGVARQQMLAAGFRDIQVKFRVDVNALLVADK